MNGLFNVYAMHQGLNSTSFSLKISKFACFKVFLFLNDDLTRSRAQLLYECRQAKKKPGEEEATDF